MEARSGVGLDSSDQQHHIENAQGTKRIAGATSPRARARITGAIYLLFFLTAILGEFLTRQAGISGLGVVSGDAAALANVLLTHQTSFWTGFALSLISVACYIAVTALFYRLFKPVSRSLALLATCFSLVGLIIQVFGSLFQLAPLVMLSGSPYLSVFDVKQLQAMALMFLNLGNQVAGIGLVFDGLFLLLIGYLIFWSVFLPRVLGVLMMLAGLGWLTYVVPPLAHSLSPYIQILGIVAEGSLLIWLLTMGVNAQQWEERAAAARELDESVSDRVAV